MHVRSTATLLVVPWDWSAVATVIFICCACDAWSICSGLGGDCLLLQSPLSALGCLVLVYSQETSRIQGANRNVGGVFASRGDIRECHLNAGPSFCVWSPAACILGKKEVVIHCCPKAYGFEKIMIVLGTISTMSDHGGFCFPLLPGSIQPDFHDWHHENFRENFGLLGFLDWVHGTSTAWLARWKDRRALILSAK